MELLTRVFPDTSVCFPISVLDLILRCDERDLHRIVWSEDLLAELERVWVREGARDEDSAGRVTHAIRTTFALQEIPRQDYAHLIDAMPGPDVEDHCHSAAAVAVAPSVLLTANLKDFPAVPFADLGVTVLAPDDYACDLLTAHPDELDEIISAMAADRRNPPMTPGDVLDALDRAGLTRFAVMARQA